MAQGKIDLSKIQTKLLINNKWVDSVSGKTLPVYNPTTGEKIIDVQKAGKEDVDKAVEAARKAFLTWKNTDGRTRGILLHKLADLIEKHCSELASLETLNSGKPLKSMVMVSDMPMTISCYRYYAGWADKLNGEIVPVEGNNFAFTLKEPVGVCAQIIPWNWPIMMQALKLGPALAAGCTVILKPSEFTPLTALRVGELVIEAGFPPGVVNIIPGYGYEIGEYLAKHPQIDKLAFTGSTTVGKLLQHAATDSNLKRVSLELGGKGAHIIFEDADMELAIKNVFRGVFANTGQNCAAASRVYVHESIYDTFIEKVIEGVKKIKVGDPFSDDTELGPHTTENQFNKTISYIKQGKEEGAKLLIGGNRWGDKGWYVEPTVFADATDKMKIATDEIFGPVMILLKFKDVKEVIDRTNNTIFGLTAGIQTRDVTKALAVASNIQAGTIWINNYLDTSVGLPFGGFKQSGIGRELGGYGLENYLEIKSVCLSMEGFKDVYKGNPVLTSE
jgi:aldehyde dehydrogenase (NAD+)